MPDAILTVTPAALPEGSCYSTEQERLNAFAAAISISLPGNYSTVNTGSSAPAANDRDKPWLRTNVDGSPDGLYYYFDGSWKRKHPLDPGIHIIWTGASGDVPTLDGGTSAAITTQTGAFWEIDTAFAAKFPVGVGSFASGTAVAVGGTGGEEKHVLTTAELPSVLGDFAGTVTRAVAKRTGTGGATFTAGGPWDSWEFSDFITGGSDDGHNTLPPYIGVYVLRRTSRIYYSI